MKKYKYSWVCVNSAYQFIGPKYYADGRQVNYTQLKLPLIKEGVEFYIQQEEGAQKIRIYSDTAQRQLKKKKEPSFAHKKIKPKSTKIKNNPIKSLDYTSTAKPEVKMNSDVTLDTEEKTDNFVSNVLNDEAITTDNNEKKGPEIINGREQFDPAPFLFDLDRVAGLSFSPVSLLPPLNDNAAKIHFDPLLETVDDNSMEINPKRNNEISFNDITLSNHPNSLFALNLTRFPSHEVELEVADRSTLGIS